MTLALARAALVAAVVFAMTRPAPAGAQWFKYPMTGVPRTAAGALDVNAPAPRGADGKPDVPGWWLGHGPPPWPPGMRDGGDRIRKIPLPRPAGNIAIGLPGPPFQPWAAELVRQRSATDTRDDPHAKCLPSYVPRNYTLPHYQKFFQSPGVLLMLNEFNASYRQIFIDGRPRPVDPPPSWNG